MERFNEVLIKETEQNNNTKLSLFENLYEKDLSLAPYKIPLKDINLDLKNFQNRKKPYSEYSVKNIIDSVLNGNFDIRIFDRIILRTNHENKKLYILAGHSRYEAFFRLNEISKNPNDKNYLKVKEFIKKTGYDFSKILGIIMEDIHFNKAKFIALMSNALASSETDVERAEIYRSFRNIGENTKFVEDFGIKCEKSNWRRINAYSYLNPNGKMIGVVEQFELGEEDNHTIKKIAYRLGNLRKKYLNEISDLHEKELCDRLLTGGGYGTQKGQINTFSKFMEMVGKHIENLKNNGNLNPNKLLNILGIESLSFSMKEYYNCLSKIKKLKTELYKDFHIKHRDYNKNVVKYGGEKNTEKLLNMLKNKINKPIDFLNYIEQTEIVLININEMPIDKKQIKKALNSILLHINNLEQEYYKLKEKKDKFISFSKNELKLNFQE
ncbi:MAG: hypothetical protein WC872_00055 [Candidatus Absconditabacterales bacterium]